jgi:F-type H+-transporting ATPase subunit b
MEILAVARVLDEHGLAFAAEGAEGAGLSINLFWIIVAGLNFIIFALIAYRVVLMPVGKRLDERRDRIEQGLKDADAARRDREAAADHRQGILNEARREASDIVQRAQKVADDERAKGVAQTQAEIDRMRERAVAEIDAERKRALADVRSQVADLALLAAGKLIGETINDAREKRLVSEFLAQVSAQAPAGDERN